MPVPYYSGYKGSQIDAAVAQVGVNTASIATKADAAATTAALAAKLAIANDLSEFNSQAHRIAARANLDVLWSQSTRSWLSKKFIKGGISTDGSALWRINGIAAGGIALGLGDFSITAVITLHSYAYDTVQNIFTTHVAGNNKITLAIRSQGDVQLGFVDNAGAATFYTMTPDVPLVARETYMITVTVKRNGLATLYVNGVSDQDKSGAGVTVDVSPTSGINIGSGNTNTWGMLHTFKGIAHDVWVWNYVMPVQYVAFLAQEGYPDIGQQFGQIAALYTSDFSVGADGWVLNVDTTPTGNNDGVTDGTTSKNDTLKLATGTGVALHIAVKLLSVSKLDLRITGSYYIPPGQNVNGVKLTSGGEHNVDVGNQTDLVAVGTWTTFDIFLRGTVSTSISFYLMKNLVTTFNGVAGEAVYFKDLVVYKAGVVFNPDFHFSDPAISPVVRDLNPNSLSHGVMTVCGQYRPNLGSYLLGVSAPVFNTFDDLRGSMVKKMAKGGLSSDGLNVFRINGTAGINLGLNDFSLVLVIQSPTYTPVSSQVFIASHTTGNNRIDFRITSTGVVQLLFTDNAGSVATYSFTPDVPLVGGNAYLFILACSRAGNATLYINGLTDRDVNGTGVVTSIAASSAVDIGSGNANVWGLLNTTVGTLHDCWVMNQVLSAAAAFGLAANGGLLYSQQDASLAPVYTSNFSAGADSFATHTDITPSGNVDGVTDGTTSKDDTLKLTTGTGTSIHLVARASSFPSNKAIRITGSYYIPTGMVFNAIRIGQANIAAPSGGSTFDLSVVGAWTNFSQELYGTAAGATSLYAGLLVGTTTTFNGVSGQAAYLKDIVITKIGSIFDPDLQNADPAISLAVRDRNSSANHGTANASTTVFQSRITSQANVGQIAIGSTAVLKKLLTNTASLDFGSIAAAASGDLTIGVTGAAVGDSVALGPPSAPTAGIIYQAFVSASNVVTVRATNITAAPVDPAAQTFRVTVFQF